MSVELAGPRAPTRSHQQSGGSYASACRHGSGREMNFKMLAIPEVLLRALRIFGRLVAWCAAATVSLLAAGCGGGSPVVARSDSSSTATVTIDAAEQYQRIAGFGVAEGFGQAKTLMSMPASVQKQVLSLLYSPTRGAGLTILRNEISADKDSMIVSQAQTANFMHVLGATLARSGLSTRAECCARISWKSAQQYVAAIETDQAANPATALFTSHGYFAAPNSPLRGWSKPVWQTEWAPFGHQPWDAAWDDGSPSSGFTWAQNIDTGLTAANLGAFLYLWGANTSTTAMTGPNTGLVEVNGNTVAASGRLWAFANYSRFIRPGAVRIGTTTRRAGLEVSAFRNSDGSTAVIVLNSAHSRQAATFSLRGLGAAHVTPYLTDTSHGLSVQTPITVQEQRLHRDPAPTVARQLRHQS